VPTRYEVVSAGMDMTYGFLNDLHGKEFASNAVCRIEHTWREEK